MDARFDGWRRRIDATLECALPDPAHAPHRLHAAMRHAALGGGKRMRPLLVYATAFAFGTEGSALDNAAAAVELIHAYSLVHDDLPAMDDDDLRRGRPTVHVAFDEATAILAGDALQSLAFLMLSTAEAAPTIVVAMLRELAGAAGAGGMCGGQALDIDATGQGTLGQGDLGQGSLAAASPAQQNPAHRDVSQAHAAARDADHETGPDPLAGPTTAPAMSLAALERLHTLKTGALLRASVRLGALVAGVEPTQAAHLDRFADALGLAFQIRDDLLDVEGDSARLGKTAGKDAAQDKATFPALIGRNASRARLDELSLEMQLALAGFDARADALRALGRSAISRTR